VQVHPVHPLWLRLCVRRFSFFHLSATPFYRQCVCARVCVWSLCGANRCGMPHLPTWCYLSYQFKHEQVGNTGRQSPRKLVCSMPTHVTWRGMVPLYE